jgi:prolipoprotein diacylglyceryltransferase
MSIKSFVKDARKVSIISIFIIFLALIRCVTEPFRLQHYSVESLTFVEIKPFLIGSLVTSLALLIMTILSFLGKYKIINATCILTIVVLLIIKRIYMPT